MVGMSLRDVRGESEYAPKSDGVRFQQHAQRPVRRPNVGFAQPYLGGAELPLSRDEAHSFYVRGKKLEASQLVAGG